MPDNDSIPISTLKVAMPSMVAGALAFGLLPILGINLSLGKSGGLILALGILLFGIALEFGKRLGLWIVGGLSCLGSFLFLLGATAVIR